MLADFFKDYGAPFAWGIAALGWLVSSRQANTREKRKEFRSEIDAIECVVKMLLGKFPLYFKATVRDDVARALEFDISMLFRELDLKAERLHKRQQFGTLRPYFDTCSKCRSEFFGYTTGKFFETEERIPHDLIGVHIYETHLRALFFMEALHSLFLKKFDGI